MHITKIKLENVQCHEKLELEFSNGVNVICGASDRGKSSIRRAFEWVFFNKNIDSIRKTGSKVTSVIVFLNNGTEVEKVRSASINRYIVRKNGEEQVFDKIGRNIPDEVKDALQIEPIEIDGEDIYLNTQNQLGLPFLMDKSPSVRMKLFNKLTGNDLLDKLFSEFNKDILRIKRNKKTQEEIFDGSIVELKTKKRAFEQKQIIYKKLNNKIEKLKQNDKIYSKLLELNSLQKKNKLDIEDTENRYRTIKSVEPIVIKQLMTSIERHNNLKQLFKSFLSNKEQLSHVSMVMRKIVPQTHDFGEIRARISRLDSLTDLCYTYNTTQVGLTKNKNELKDNMEFLTQNINKYKKVLKEVGVCPTCKNNITEECLNGIKL